MIKKLGFLWKGYKSRNRLIGFLSNDQGAWFPMKKGKIQKQADRSLMK